MNKLTIQINNLEALERLIGGDTEIELEIRNNIVQAFTKKYLKQLVNESQIKYDILREITPSIKKVAQEIQKEVIKEQTEYRINLVNNSKDELEKIQNHIKYLVEQSVTKVVEEKIAKSLEPYIDPKLIRLKELLKLLTDENTSNS